MREGDRFDNYVLREKIAEGGMAEIFRAERVGAMNISREVCVKCIRSALCTDAEFVRMFIDEARISATLRHSNIVSIDHFGSHDGALFSVMEWVHGTDASKVVKRLAAQGRAMPVDVALFIVAEVLKALEYAHGKTDGGEWLRIVHRDVTPHNVMVSYSGEVKLTDFGIAKATSRLHHTQGDVVRGKVSYMAPEQAMGLTLDHRTDLFAVGVVAYELLAGRKPFVGSSQVEGVHAMLRGEHPPLRALRPDVSYDVEALIEQLLANKPDDRFTDAGAALDALQHVPALGTGQRGLQRLMRELYDDVQHSTVVPRFGANGEPAVEPSDATVPSSAAALLGLGDTSSAPTTPKTIERTAPASAERTLTSDTGASAGSEQGPRTAPTVPAQRSSPVAVAALVAPTPAQPPVAAPSRAPWIAVTAALASMLVAGVTWVATRPSGGPPTPPITTPQPPPPRVEPAPPVIAARDAGAPAVAAVDASAPTALDAGIAMAEGPVRPARLEVTINPWGTVIVNGQRRESTATYTLAPGRYRVVGEMRDRRASKTVTLRPGESRHLSINIL